MDWIQLYYVLYLAVQIGAAAALNGKSLEIGISNTLLLPTFHLPFMGRVLGWW